MKTISGQWWAPDKPARKLWGALEELDTYKWVLKLAGSLIPAFYEEETTELSIQTFVGGSREAFPLLVGITNEGEYVSLLDCRERNITHHLGGLKSSSEINPRVIVHGVHFESWDDFRLVHLSVGYSNLDEWVSTSAFSLKFNDKGRPTGIDYAKPDNIEVRAGSSRNVGIGFTARLDTARHRHAGISQQTWLSVEDDEPTPFDKLWEVLANLANLIALGVGKSLRWGDISGQVLVNNGSKESVSITYNREPLAPNVKEIPAQDMLFTLPVVRERFDEIVSRWLHRDDSFESLFRLYFGTIQSPFMYVEQRFLNMFQALESYHRRSCVPDVAGESKHRARTQRILAKHEGNDREWLEKRISWRNEQTAENRIADLVKQLDAAWLLTPDEIKGAAILRNYYTHYDETRKGLPEKEKRVTRLINLGAKLRILCELVLLDTIGFAKADVRESMKTSGRLERWSVSESH